MDVWAGTPTRRTLSTKSSKGGEAGWPVAAKRKRRGRAVADAFDPGIQRDSVSRGDRLSAAVEPNPQLSSDPCKYVPSAASARSWLSPQAPPPGPTKAIPVPNRLILAVEGKVLRKCSAVKLRASDPWPPPHLPVAPGLSVFQRYCRTLRIFRSPSHLLLSRFRRILGVDWWSSTRQAGPPKRAGRSTALGPRAAPLLRRKNIRTKDLHRDRPFAII